jgi:hypothetical protein
LLEVLEEMIVELVAVVQQPLVLMDQELLVEMAELAQLLQ